MECIKFIIAEEELNRFVDNHGEEYVEIKVIDDEEVVCICDMWVYENLLYGQYEITICD